MVSKWCRILSIHSSTPCYGRGVGIFSLGQRREASLRGAGHPVHARASKRVLRIPGARSSECHLPNGAWTFVGPRSRQNLAAQPEKGSSFLRLTEKKTQEARATESWICEQSFEKSRWVGGLWGLAGLGGFGELGGGGLGGLGRLCGCLPLSTKALNKASVRPELHPSAAG